MCSEMCPRVFAIKNILSYIVILKSLGKLLSFEF